jgi:hypothetical protein
MLRHQNQRERDEEAWVGWRSPEVTVASAPLGVQTLGYQIVSHTAFFFFWY